LRRNHATILDNLTREEQRFQRTVEAGVAKLENLLTRLKNSKIATLPGEQAFDLYATYGLPVEITRDIAREMDLDVDESGFRAAMEEHRLASGAGEVFGIMGGEQTDIYRSIMEELVQKGELPSQGVYYDPYSRLEVHAPVLSILRNGQPVARAEVGDEIEVILPETCFYVESGGQVSDIGVIKSNQKPFWEVAVENTRKPAAGVIVHFGKVVTGTPKTGDLATAKVAGQRRQDIMRNHTATHLLHRELRAVLGEHARQAGSLVAPDRLRFDFTHPDGLTPQQLEQIEAGVNQKIFGDYNLQIAYKPLQQAIAEGAIALFGEKYSETVRNITIGDPDPFSNELCGGTHVESTGDIGVFLITSEGSTAAGIRRIEAVTGRGAYELIQRRFKALRHTASVLSASLEDVPVKAENLHNELATSRKQITALRRELVEKEFIRKLDAPELIHNVPVLTVLLPDTDADTLRLMADQFRQSYPTGVAVLASVYAERPLIVASVSDNLLARGINAVDLVRFVAAPIGGSGGGKPTLAQAGGKDANKLGEALSKAHEWLNQNLK
jgi:alanyl-tRNA synthetase